MKKIVIGLAVLAGAAAVAAKGGGEADPVIMTVAGKAVPLSEFEYLYNKNNDQQIERQDPASYAEMFVNYKLKVADAEAHGVDTTQAFRDELEQHRQELARPYLVDSAVQARLVADVYGRMGRIVDVSHVMLPLGRTTRQADSLRHALDSLRTLIVGGRADFGDIAEKHSIDPQAKRNRGHMGWMRANVYPHTFEEVAYATPVGEISQVMETPFGYHIILVNAVKENPGEVDASHILKMTRRLGEAEQARKRAEIDSLYTLLTAHPAADTFAAAARSESDDRGSAARGGRLGWFGTGQMVPEFEAAAFALADGEMSAPVESQFGYHLILKHGHRGVPPIEEVRDAIQKRIDGDDRSQTARRARIDSYIASRKGGLQEKGLKKVEQTLRKQGYPDSAAIAAVRGLEKVVVAKVGNTVVSAAEVAAMLPAQGKGELADWMGAYRKAADGKLQSVATEMLIDELPAREPAYRNLLNEYRDGILLFEVSNRNVWDKALKDTDGLADYFNRHRADYRWEKPHYKGYIVFATTDSLLEKARAWTEANRPAPEKLADDLKREFGRDIRVERVLAAEGDNAITDAVGFGGEAPDLSGQRWPYYFDYAGHVAAQPEEWRDVRGAVSADYQQELEDAWVKQLRATYPVSINEAELRSMHNAQ